MSRSANVQSIDVMDQMALAVRAFAQEASVALDDVRMGLYRALQWVQYDQKEYWVQESRRAEEAVAEARLNLERKRMFRLGDHEPPCHEEKKALEAAKRRVDRAREKLDAVKRWSRLLDRESHECRGGIAPLADWIQTDVPRALAMLKQLSLALDAYVDLAPPMGDSAGASPGENATGGQGG